MIGNFRFRSKFPLKIEPKTKIFIDLLDHLLIEISFYFRTNFQQVVIIFIKYFLALNVDGSKFALRGCQFELQTDNLSSMLKKSYNVK